MSDDNLTLIGNLLTLMDNVKAIHQVWCIALYIALYKPIHFADRKKVYVQNMLIRHHLHN